MERGPAVTVCAQIDISSDLVSTLVNMAISTTPVALKAPLDGAYSKFRSTLLHLVCTAALALISLKIPVAVRGWDSAV